MPVSEQQANDILAEFLERGGHVVSLAPAKKSRKKLAESKPDPIERCEFEPDNSRIGRQSRGLQSKPSDKIYWMFVTGMDTDAIAKAMVEEFHDWKRGIVAQSAFCTVVFE